MAAVETKPPAVETRPPAVETKPPAVDTPDKTVSKEANADSPAATPATTKKKNKKKNKRGARKPTLKTKVVVRRLPPNLPEDIFMNSVKLWINETTVDYSVYVPGKLSKSKAKESLFSRAYFHLKSMEAVVAFHQGFDGHVFMDNKGNESRAVVEFAPYQKIPKEHKSADVRQGTIDEDQDYLDFLESLKKEETDQSALHNETADGLTQIERLENRIAMVTAKTLAAEQANKPKTTPLLEHLRAQKAAQAAAKAKSAAKKSARKKADKAGTPKKNDHPKTIQQPPASSQQQNAAATSNSADGKKKRERSRKKKEDGSAKKPATPASSSATESGSATPTASTSKQNRPAREPKEAKPKENRAPRDSRPPKDNNRPKEVGSKPKRQRDKKLSSEEGANQQWQVLSSDAK